MSLPTRNKKNNGNQTTNATSDLPVVPVLPLPHGMTYTFESLMSKNGNAYVLPDRSRQSPKNGGLTAEEQQQAFENGEDENVTKWGIARYYGIPGYNNMKHGALTRAIVSRVGELKLTANGGKDVNELPSDSGLWIEAWNDKLAEKHANMVDNAAMIYTIQKIAYDRFPPSNRKGSGQVRKDFYFETLRQNGIVGICGCATLGGNSYCKFAKKLVGQRGDSGKIDWLPSVTTPLPNFADIVENDSNVDKVYENIHTDYDPGNTADKTGANVQTETVKIDGVTVTVPVTAQPTQPTKQAATTSNGATAQPSIASPIAILKNEGFTVKDINAMSDERIALLVGA